MAVGQTTIAESPTAAANAGQLADSTRLSDCASYVSEEASSEIPFGRMLKQGTAVDGCLLMTAQADAMIGISVFTQARERDVQLGDTGIKPKCMVTVAKRGRIWVSVSEAVTPASTVRVHKTGGTFLATASAGNTVVLKHARYLTSTSGAGLAMLEFDILMRADNSSD